MRRYLSVVAVALSLFTECAATEYQAQDFFRDANAEYFEAYDTLSERDKQRLIAGQFAQGLVQDPAFDVVSHTPERLTFQNLIIQVYPVTRGGHLVSVTAVLGNHGQTQYIDLYDINPKGEIVGKVELKDYGVEPVLANEFLAASQHFPSSENYPVPLLMEEDGNIQAQPWTWMVPQWETRDIVRQVHFVWNGERFDKRVSPPVMAGVTQWLNDAGPHQVPDDVLWQLVEVQRTPCRICTSDIHILEGQVRLNGVWVSGTLEFSLIDGSEVLIDSGSKFALGDGVNRVSIQPQQ